MRSYCIEGNFADFYATQAPDAKAGGTRELRRGRKKGIPLSVPGDTPPGMPRPAAHPPLLGITSAESPLQGGICPGN